MKLITAFDRNGRVAAPAATPATRVIARLDWGSGPGEVGGGPRGAAAGTEPVPPSFLMDADGALHVLDAVNRRILVVRTGAPPTVVPLSALGEAARPADFARCGAGWLVSDPGSRPRP